MNSLQKYHEQLKLIKEQVIKELLEKGEASYKIDGFEIVKFKNTEDQNNDITLQLDELLQIIEVSALLGARRFSIFEDIIK